MTNQGSEFNGPGTSRDSTQVSAIEEAAASQLMSAAGGTTPDAQSKRSNQVGSDEWIGAKRFELTDLAGGCVVATSSAVVSCVLLVINGAFVMALLSVVAGSGQAWISNEKLSQFLLFSCPVLLLFIQWWLIDTLRWILRKRSS